MRLVRGFERFAASHVTLAETGATADHLAQINALPGVLKPLAASDVFVRGIRLCNDQPFKDGRRRITRNGIEQIAGKMRGVPMMLNHDVYSREALPVGRAFAGSVETVGEVQWAAALFYVLRDAAGQGEALIEAIDGGQLTEASIGMYAASFTCSVCGKEVGDPECKHVAGMDYGDKGGLCLYEYDGIEEVEEFSAVMSGMIEGTHYFLAASRQHPDALDPDEMEAAAVLNALGKTVEEQIAAYFEQPARDPWQAFKKSA